MKRGKGMQKLRRQKNICFSGWVWISMVRCDGTVQNKGGRHGKYPCEHLGQCRRGQPGTLIHAVEKKGMRSYGREDIRWSFSIFFFDWKSIFGVAGHQVPLTWRCQRSLTLGWRPKIVVRLRLRSGDGVRAP